MNLKPTITYTDKSSVGERHCFLQQIIQIFNKIECLNLTNISEPFSLTKLVQKNALKNHLAIFGPIDGLYIVLYSDENNITYCFSNTTNDKQFVN